MNEERCLNHETRISKLEGLLENHIPHINRAIDRIEGWIRGIAIFMVTAVVALIIDHFVR